MSDEVSAAPIDPLALGPLPGLLGYALRRAQLAVFADFHRVMAPLGLRTAQFSALVVLRANPGVRASRVAEALGIQRANFATLLAGMQKAGWVARRIESRDRRAIALELTPTGHDLLVRAEAALQPHEARWRERFGTEDHRRLLGMLQRVP